MSLGTIAPPTGLNLAKTKDLQVLPSIAMQALQMVKSSDCKMSAFAHVIEKDLKLTSDILKMANSCLFAAGKAVSRIYPAVVRLGFRPVQNMILSSSLASLMNKMTVEEEWIRKLLWRHAITTAKLSQLMNQELKLDFQGEEFTAGLIHDIGRMLFALCVPDQFESLDPLEFDESDATLTHEGQAIGTNHCQLGAWFTSNHRVPPELVDVVLHHHQPSQSKVNRLLVSLTAVSDHMANFMQRTESDQGYDPTSNPFVADLEQCGVPGFADCFGELAQTVMPAAATAADELMAT